MILIEVIQLCFLIVAAIAVCMTKHLLRSVILFTAYSIIISILWILLRAPDLGITEAAVGTGISNMLFFVVLKRIRVMEEEHSDMPPQSSADFTAAMAGSPPAAGSPPTVGSPPAAGNPPSAAHPRPAGARREHARRMRTGLFRFSEKTFFRLYSLFGIVFGLFLFSILLIMIGYLPQYGAPDNPAHNEVSQRYIEQGVSETGAVNVVSGMILDYRGFDTFGESCVLFVAVCAVLSLLRREERDAFDELLHEMEESTHDVILKQVSHIMVPLIALFGIYVVIGGHLSPGGGFSGGAILGAAMILFACSFGTIEVRRVFSYVNCRRIMTGALLFYAALKGCAMYAGANGFYTGIPLGTSGTIFSAGLLLPLNIAVGIIVACTMYILYILFSKGEML